MIRALPLLTLLCLGSCNSRPPKLPDACIAHQDCAITRQGSDCCFGCDSFAGTVEGVNARLSWCARKFPGGASGHCAEPKCIEKSITAYCVDDRCVVRDL